MFWQHRTGIFNILRLERRCRYFAFSRILRETQPAHGHAHHVLLICLEEAYLWQRGATPLPPLPHPPHYELKCPPPPFEVWASSFLQICPNGNAASRQENNFDDGLVVKNFFYFKLWREKVTAKGNFNRSLLSWARVEHTGQFEWVNLVMKSRCSWVRFPEAWKGAVIAFTSEHWLGWA